MIRNLKKIANKKYFFGSILFVRNRPMSVLFHKKKSEAGLNDPKKAIKVETKGNNTPKLNLNIEKNIDVLEGLENVK